MTCLPLYNSKLRFTSALIIINVVGEQCLCSELRLCIVCIHLCQYMKSLLMMVFAGFFSSKCALCSVAKRSSLVGIRLVGILPVVGI